METPQLIVFGTIALALGLFVWGRFRHDIVAMFCLLILVVSGVVPTEDAFSGFAHPAVVTVAVILVVSRGLEQSGLVDLIGKWMDKLGQNMVLQITLLSTLVCITSAFINNVGALAVLMPVAIHIATKNGYSPSLFLMPIAFASLLGGMLTLIGTPPNIIISAFREEQLGAPFSMFDFLPVGAGAASVGLVFIALIAWRLIPERIGRDSRTGRFDIDDYITEVYVTKEAKIKDLPISELPQAKEDGIQILNLVRNGQLLHAPDMSLRIQEDDILTISGDADDLKSFISSQRLRLVGRRDQAHEDKMTAADSANISEFEAVVMAESPLYKQTARGLQMRSRYGVNLLAISRQGEQISKRIDRVRFKVGDVLLLQGDARKMDAALQSMGCLPLADRGFSLGKQSRKIAFALAIFAGAISLVILDLVKVEIAFLIAALGMVVSRILSPREIYSSIDWPVVVLLGALLPLGIAMETTGGAALIADAILRLGGTWPAWTTLAALFVTTMLLSNIINNAAAVVLMAPIGLKLSEGLSVAADPFLMAIAVSASAAFLTPIGHQSNTLVMGPGGYHFTDYTRVGLPLSLLVALVAIPLILLVWPL